MGPPVVRALLAILAAATVLAPGCRNETSERRSPSTEPVALPDALGGDARGFARAERPGPFSFPRDHGPHPDYKHEWWYFTGNLTTEGGRHFGYQLTFFRLGLLPGPPGRPSKWASNELFMAHFALSDVAGKRFHRFERVSREALRLAGATGDPFRVWLTDWTAEGTAGRTWPVRLRAGEDGTAIDLSLAPAGPIVLQGDRGLSRKSAEPGNASHYYSVTRLASRGSIRIGVETFAVSGASWLDREWGTSALGKEQAGWDWFALHLSDGRDLMFYRLRRKDGSVDPYSAGTLVRPDGSTRPLALPDVTLEVLDFWRSPRTGVRYPARWRLAVPSEGLSLAISPYLPDQELPLSVRYWEGAVFARGTSGGVAVSGDGYAELTGYR